MGEIQSPGAEYADQLKAPETETRVDFAQMERSFTDGTAGEYHANVGALPVEAFLEEQGDDDTWREKSVAEQAPIRQNFVANVDRYNMRLAEDDNELLMAIAV